MSVNMSLRKLGSHPVEEVIEVPTELLDAVKYIDEFKMPLGIKEQEFVARPVSVRATSQNFVIFGIEGKQESRRAEGPGQEQQVKVSKERKKHAESVQGRKDLSAQY